MKALIVPLKEAEKAHAQIMKAHALDSRYTIRKEGDHIVFPITTDLKTRWTLQERQGVKRARKPTFSQLAAKIDKEKKAFDIIGDIAIIEADGTPQDKAYAQLILDMHKNIKTVLKKKGSHEGEYRTQAYTWVCGEKKKTATHKENGVTISLDVEKVYFSPRLSTERKRICALIKKGEVVVVMFSGCAPYPVTISKNTDAAKVYGIELNPHGHEWGTHNVKANKCRNVELINGDVRAEYNQLKGIADRVVMPLPKQAHTFLAEAVAVCKRHATIHLYIFDTEAHIKEAATHALQDITACGAKGSLLGTHACGQSKPYEYRWCVDISIKKS
ncbi:MAG: hypothetical protein ABIH41_01105 [Nanoarchaeota archaeon]